MATAMSIPALLLLLATPVFRWCCSTAGQSKARGWFFGQVTAMHTARLQHLQQLLVSGATAEQCALQKVGRREEEKSRCAEGGEKGSDQFLPQISVFGRREEEKSRCAEGGEKTSDQFLPQISVFGTIDCFLNFPPVHHFPPSVIVKWNVVAHYLLVFTAICCLQYVISILLSLNIVF
ncbi:uncharacterized protein LOC133918159 isoform X2 [Phragmites australis]|uniref:uncharacterized protein LOC133918159 isoform X2 n=1 Tax=Phragmites australis TaxID=29695 RepID=UPI002D777E3F|nr:uncharacterized protein LOC133918159 isoform X2 [Phragmites australis]